MAAKRTGVLLDRERLSGRRATAGMVKEACMTRRIVEGPGMRWGKCRPRDSARSREARGSVAGLRDIGGGSGVG
jgi:hypothetical protein